TSLINAPMNDALAVAEVTDAAAVWDAFAPDWTLSNHARTLAAAISMLLSAEALRRAARV
ncbi:MAG: hypothetical protein AAFU55_05955, partial [Pseudomonadota bacterium]